MLSAMIAVVTYAKFFLKDIFWCFIVIALRINKLFADFTITLLLNIRLLVETSV